MQFKKIVAAGAMAAIMIGATVGFAATMADFPSPFVTSTGVQSLVVVGAAAAPSDVVGAIDIATRLGGEVTTDYTCPGAVGAVTVTGEGKEIGTSTTKIFLNDNLGKTGLRKTLTKDDLPTILADGTFTDSQGTTHKYSQYIGLTPGNTTATKYKLAFNTIGSVSGSDPVYHFGSDTRFPTSPSASDYFYSTKTVFEKDLNTNYSIGYAINLFGKDYTITSGTAFDASTPKLVLSGSATTKVLSAGEKVTVTIGGTSYDVTLVGVSSATSVVVKVGSDQKSITTTSPLKKIGGLDVYLSDAFWLSSTDLTQNSAKLLLGAEKLTLENGQKVKVGDSEDPMDGTLVALTTSSGQLSMIQVYAGAKSTTQDYIKSGDRYTDPLWKSFDVSLNSVSPSEKAETRTITKILPSGDNQMQLQFTDHKGNAATLTWAKKAGTSASTHSLTDAVDKTIHVRENATIARDEYFVADPGDFTRMFKVTDVSLTGTTAARINLQDVFSGTTITVNTGADNEAEKIIDGQSYYFAYVSSGTFKVTWGSEALINSTGSFQTVYPYLRGKNGEKLAFANTVSGLLSGTKLQLPSGAAAISYTKSATADITANWTITEANNEDGSNSIATNLTTKTNANSVVFSLGLTSTGGLKYNLSIAGAGVASATTYNLTPVGSGTDGLSQPAILFYEEKDDAGNRYGLVVAADATSGTTIQSRAASPVFTDTLAAARTWGSNSNKQSWVDIYGTYVERDTATQGTVTIYYPDDQVFANMFVLGEGATVSTTGAAAATTVKQAVPVKTALGKLDTEITASDKTNKNLILVGGPAVNTLVKELADANKTKARDWYVSQGAGTAIINLVADAFTSGKTALVVAGHSAADTRAATGILQTYDTYETDFTGKTLVVIKNGVISTATA